MTTQNKNWLNQKAPRVLEEIKKDRLIIGEERTGGVETIGGMREMDGMREDIDGMSPLPTN